MHEDTPGMTEKLLLLKEQLQPFMRIARQAALKIKQENISNYPIFVAHQDQVEIGIPLITSDEFGGVWSLNASTLEEFYSRLMIRDEKLKDFKELYNSHSDDICFFVLSELGTQFLFLPVK